MIKDRIFDIVKKAIEESGYSSEKFTLTKASRPEFGDYATSHPMALAKELKKDPFEIAGEIAQIIQIVDPIGSVKIVRPGFINISLSQNYLLDELQKIIEQKEKYGTIKINEEQKVIVEYSSPNIAKPFTIGHLRSTIIGDAIANLLAATGHKVYRDNHVGDWGTQFGKQIYAIQKWGNLKVIETSENPVKELVSLYVKFHEESEKDPTLEDEARAIFKKLEEHDPDITSLWKKCIDWSFREFDRIYRELNVSFTENDGHGYGESFFEDKMKDVITELETKEFYKENKGAKLVFFPDDKYPPLMIIKQDGATLYGTRDLATDKFRLTNERYSPLHKIINEVGAEQSLYFQQLYETEKMLGWVKDEERVHVKHGLYRFKDMKMSTRKGNTIWLEDVLKEAEERASDLNKNDESESKAAARHELSAEEKMKTARAVGIGALKWNDLKRSSHLDIVFDWDEILNMQGNSGPYMQYTYVRCLSILNQSENVEFTEVTDSIISFEELENNLMRILAGYPDVINDASAHFAPHFVCSYLFDVAQLYNLFYQKLPILKVDDMTKKKLRLMITKATAQVIQNGLQLLGITPVTKM